MWPRSPSIGGAGLAFALLVLGLLVDDFLISYIASHHSTSTPFLFTIATA
ncbi:MAG: hypothetical protein OER12_06005 [Acidimicrobiia bacterium]|nr:hypothetical protein [Acidimicrobiia bacterium]